MKCFGRYHYPGELRNKINDLWTTFWTCGLINPLDVIEQITYLMFIKDLDILDNTHFKEAFSKYLDETSFTPEQIYFVNQIVEYVSQNGVLSDPSILMESPFTDRGSIVTLFPDLTVWGGIKGVIDQINGNADIGH